MKLALNILIICNIFLIGCEAEMNAMTKTPDFTAFTFWLICLPLLVLARVKYKELDESLNRPR